MQRPIILDPAAHHLGAALFGVMGCGLGAPVVTVFIAGYAAELQLCLMATVVSRKLF